MKLFKAEKSASRIVSVSVSSSGLVVATSGDGGDILLWSIEAFEKVVKSDVPVKADVDKVRPLKTLSHHGAGVDVECVRFNKNGDMLMSGDTSGKVYLTKMPWEDSVVPELLIDFCSEQFGALWAEIRKCEMLRKLLTEDESVTDICWSNDGRIAAVASLNNKVILYDVLTRRIVAIVDDFQASIKSVSLDPTGNFLVVISNNKNVYVYQYIWSVDHSKIHIKLVLVVNKTLQKSLLTSQFSRFNWSPNGNLVAIPNGTKEVGYFTQNTAGSNNSKSSMVINVNATDITHTYSLNNVTIIAILSPLNGFKNMYSLVGHQFSSLETSKFNPRLFKVTGETPGDPSLNQQISNNKYYSIVATGGLDKTLVIWSTILDRPLLVGKEFCSGTIMDIDWTSDGLCLFVGSSDGSLSYLQFAPDELGIQCSDSELGESLKQVKLKIKVLEEPPEWREDGKTDVDEKRNQKDEVDDETNNVVTNENLNETHNSETHNSFTKETPTHTAQTVKATKGGKKRVAPLLVSGYKPKQAASCSTQPKQYEFDRPSNHVSKQTVQHKRQKKENEEKRPKLYEPLEFLNTTVVNPVTAFARLRLAVPKVALVINCQSSTNPAIQFVVRNGSGNEQKPTRISLESVPSSNGELDGSGDSLDKPFAGPDGRDDSGESSREIFVDFVPKIVNMVVGGEGRFWALSTLDGTVIVYSNSGKRLLPPIMLGVTLSFLECKDDYLMAVTSVGDLYVWNIAAKKVEFKPTNLYALFEPSTKYQDDLIVRGESLTLCSINAKGIPLVTLSNGTGYLYDKDMDSWCVISDSWWVFGSHYWDSSTVTSNKSNIIALIESKTNEEIFKKRKTDLLKKISKIMLMKRGYENLEISISLAHLENKILIAEKLQDPIEFKKLLISYCVRLSELAYKTRLVEVFQDLLGPYGDTDDFDDVDSQNSEDELFENATLAENKLSENGKMLKKEWSSKICGLDKHEMLKDILLACAKNREVQKILVQYGKAVGLLVN